MAPLAMTPSYEPNPLLARLLEGLFEHLPVDDAWVQEVRDAARRGSVVYVLRNASYIDFLALDHITKRHGLPRIGFANDLGLGVLEPFGHGWQHALDERSLSDDARDLAKALDSGRSAALFLKRPSLLRRLAAGRTGWARAVSEGDRLVRALFDLQRSRTTPILLLPQLFVWTKNPRSRQIGVVDALLGTREWPGKVRSTLELLRNYRSVVIRSGEALNLADLLAADATEIDDTTRTRRLVFSLLRKFERERRAIIGPDHKASDRLRHEVLRSPKLSATIRDLGGEGWEERLALTARANRMLRQLAAQPEPGLIRASEHVLDAIVQRIYNQVEVDQEGLERLREASKDATLVLLPSHKSHFDYLILSYVLYHANLQLPLVAAGDNLSFFPLGAFFRRTGAFFIRRSFAGDRLYAAVVDAYIRRLLREGYSIEFYVEGTRSRTGKLLPPKLGLLNMVVEATLSVPNRRVLFVPIFVGYDRIVEGSSYVQELTGGEKRKEDARGLLHTTRVLRSQYGRVSVQFGKLLSIDPILEELRAKDGREPSAGEDPAVVRPARRRALVARLAHQVMSEINAATAVTPGPVVATALLNHAGRAISHQELQDAVARLTLLLHRKGARISSSLLGASRAVSAETVSEAVRLFVDAGMVTATVPGGAQSRGRNDKPAIHPGTDVMLLVPDDKRLTLDLSKNIIVHFLAGRAIISMAHAALATAEPPEPSELSGSVPRDALEERIQALARLFRFEFVFSPDGTIENELGQVLDDMIAEGEFSTDERRRITLGAGHDGQDGRAWARFYSSIARTFLEGYRVAARGLVPLLKGPMSQKDLVRRALASGQRMFLAGEIQRPESVTRPLIENALQALGDEGYLSLTQGKVALTESFATAAAVRAIEARIAGYAVGAGP